MFIKSCNIIHSAHDYIIIEFIRSKFIEPFVAKIYFLLPQYNHNERRIYIYIYIYISVFESPG